MTGRILVPRGDAIELLDRADGSRAAITLPPGIAGVAVDERAGIVYVCHRQDRQVIVLRADDLRRMATVGDGSLDGLLSAAVDTGLRRLYVGRQLRSAGSAAGVLTVVQRHATGVHSIDRSVPLGHGLVPHHIALDAAAGLVVVAGRGSRAVPPTLVALDRYTLDELDRVRLDRRPTGLAILGPGRVRTGRDHDVVEVGTVALRPAASTAAGS